MTIGSRGGEVETAVRGEAVGGRGDEEDEDASWFESELGPSELGDVAVECLLSCSSYILLRSGSVRKIF